MNKNILAAIVSGIILLSACQPKTEYDKVKERELASGMIYKDLFLGLEFEMKRKEFFDACWKMNQEGILVNGAHELQVQYQPVLPSGKKVNMFFYPRFENDKLFFMPVEFQYQGWFPNQPDVSADELLKDVVAYLENEYGEGFFEVSNKDKTVSAFVKIDGNRLIRAFIKNMTFVRVEILDTRVKEIHEVAKI